MSIITRLLGRLSRGFDKTPAPFLALRVSYAGGMTWTIADETLVTTVSGGPGTGLTVDLTQYTLQTLAAFLASQTGYDVPYLDGSGMADLTAAILIEGAGDIAASNGDHLLGATNPNWLHMAAVGVELTLAQQAVAQIATEMATTTANGEWLDLLGSYYGVIRDLNELDAQYQPRIPAEVILPRQNNFAIVAALQTATGQPATCTNAVTFGSPQPAFDGGIDFDGTHFFNASARRIYNLFDVTIGFDLLGSTSQAEYLDKVRGQIDRLRAAGTHLRNLTLTPSMVSDTTPASFDTAVEIVDADTLAGLGSSANQGTAALVAVLAAGGPSFDSAVGTLTTAIHLAGSGQSVNFSAGSFANGLIGSSSSANQGVAAFANPLAASVAGADSATGVLTARIALVGTSSSSNSASVALSNVNPFSSDFSIDFGAGP